MATLAQCRTALEDLAARLHTVDDDDRKRHAFDRSLSCHVPDLDVTFSGQLTTGASSTSPPSRRRGPRSG